MRGSARAAGIAVALSGKPELITRWTTWAIIVPVVGLPIWSGRGATTVLAAAIAVLAVGEYARLARVDRARRCSCWPSVPGAGLAGLGWMEWVPLFALLCALPAVLSGDADGGIRRAAFTAFGSIWICWSLAHLVVFWEDAFLVCFAAAATDVAAWCGGRGLRRFGWARHPLSPLSPNKTVGGLVGAVLGAVPVLTLLGSVTPGLVFMVAVGGVLGDLLEPMIKRSLVPQAHFGAVLQFCGPAEGVMAPKCGGEARCGWRVRDAPAGAEHRSRSSATPGPPASWAWIPPR